MRLTLIAAFFGAAALAAPALADGHSSGGHVLTWAHPTKHNYCPAGLQPIVVGGVICCGTPNFDHNANMHPAPKRAKSHAPRHVVAFSKSPSDVVVFEKGQ